MQTVTGQVMISGKIEWSLWEHRPHDGEIGFRINISLAGELSARKAVRRVAELLPQNSIEWLTPSRDKWILDVAKLKLWLDATGGSKILEGYEWLQGAISIAPEVTTQQTPPSSYTYTLVRFNVFQEEFMLDKNTKIFLSHKGADKPMVRRFFACLKTLGFDPWLDEDAMPAGTELHRGINQGFQESCAAVFFITPAFRDESVIRSEINYAISEKTSKGNRFAIITLTFANETGERGQVPAILHPYVWKNVDTELDGLTEIIKALPIQLGAPDWKSG